MSKAKNQIQEFNIQSQSLISDEQIDHSFKELPSPNDDSSEEKNEINEEQLIPILHDLEISDIPPYEEETEKVENKEIKAIINNLELLEVAPENKNKLNKKISEISRIKDRNIKFNESKELNETKKVLEAENNDKEVTKRKRKNIPKSDKSKLKEPSKIFFIIKDFDKKLIGKKRNAEHNEDDLDVLNKDKFY